MLRKRVIVHTLLFAQCVNNNTLLFAQCVNNNTLLFAQCVNSNKKTTNVEFCRTLKMD